MCLFVVLMPHNEGVTVSEYTVLTSSSGYGWSLPICVYSVKQRRHCVSIYKNYDVMIMDYDHFKLSSI